jgi:hypothetical protein
MGLQFGEVFVLLAFPLEHDKPARLVAHCQQFAIRRELHRRDDIILGGLIEGGLVPEGLHVLH